MAFTCALGCLVAAMALGTSGLARAGSGSEGCSVSTLQGLYVFNAQGWNIQGRAVPKAVLDGVRFNGDGTLATTFGTVSINVVIFHGGGNEVGTYTVNEDCTGTVTITVTGVMYDTFVRPDGGQVWMIQTSGPGGTPSVLEGTATRVP